MPNFEECELAEAQNWSDPITSIHLEFKFTASVKVDHAKMLTSLVRNAKIVSAGGEIIKSNLQPLWLRDRPFLLLFSIDGVYVPSDAKLRVDLAQNVPHLISIVPIFWSRRRMWASL
jgi:hypothetical protein